MIDQNSLGRAERELRGALAANQARKTSPVFGYETFASLRGDEVEALVGELDRLRGVESGGRKEADAAGKHGEHDVEFVGFRAVQGGAEIGYSVLSMNWTSGGVLSQLTVDGCPLGEGAPTVVGWPGRSFKVVLADQSVICFEAEGR